jgi:hypothetical protein
MDVSRAGTVQTSVNLHKITNVLPMQQNAWLGEFAFTAYGFTQP